jgi:phosphatidylglycerol:prolipoprotein diacylglycerol transferase
VINITPGPVAVQLGPLAVPWYGLGYAAALILGTWLAQREAERRGIERRHVADAVLLVVLFGIVGARLYHVIDEWAFYSERPLQIILPPYSGLALYGGVAGGIVGVILFARRRGLPTLRTMDAVVPSLFFGQAIARWGNFFNQELYGPPTDLPWAIAIDCQHRIAEWGCAQYPLETTGFHPLFLYESLLTLTGGLVALWISRRRTALVRDGDLLSLWLVWYGVVRILLEGFRSGYNWTISGVPTATLIGAVAIAIGVVLFAMRDRRDHSFPEARGGDGGERDSDDEATVPATAPTPASPPAG